MSPSTNPKKTQDDRQNQRRNTRQPKRHANDDTHDLTQPAPREAVHCGTRCQFCLGRLTVVVRVMLCVVIHAVLLCSW